MNWPEQLGLTIPLVQAPMAGVSTPALAAAVSQAGGLGSIGVGAAGATVAHEMICQVRQQTGAPFNVNLFVHKTPEVDPVCDKAWLAWLKPLFTEFNAVLPARLYPTYRSFNDDPEMLDMLVHMKPPVVSFHFGLPSVKKISLLKATGAILLATVTSLEEAGAAEAAGMDAIVAQGIEAGGASRYFRSRGSRRRAGNICPDPPSGTEMPHSCDCCWRYHGRCRDCGRPCFGCRRGTDGYGFHSLPGDRRG